MFREVLHNVLNYVHVRYEMDQRYSLMLDFFPLACALSEENRVLGDRVQHEAIEFLLGGRKDRLEVLLQVSYDLGYLDPNVFAFLQKRLRLLDGPSGRFDRSSSL